jgi:hypothetical protein
MTGSVGAADGHRPLMIADAAFFLVGIMHGHLGMVWRLVIGSGQRNSEVTMKAIVRRNALRCANGLPSLNIRTEFEHTATPRLLIR